MRNPRSTLEVSRTMCWSNEEVDVRERSEILDRMPDRFPVQKICAFNYSTITQVYTDDYMESDVKCRWGEIKLTQILNARAQYPSIYSKLQVTGERDVSDGPPSRTANAPGLRATLVVPAPAL
jgi:hypothetical protein